MKQHLNDAQMQAILHQKGPMLVLAGPGSGKTLVITKRIERLITYGKVDPSNILVITFTRAAAKEMKERFCSVMPAEGQRVTFGTFHAVFFMILKYAYRMEASNIIREEERMQLIRDMICSMRLDYEDETELIQNLLSEISFIKNGRIDLKHYYPICCSQDIFVHVFREYESVLRRRRKINLRSEGFMSCFRHGAIFYRHGRRNSAICWLMNFRMSTRYSMILYVCYAERNKICLPWETTISPSTGFAAQSRKSCCICLRIFRMRRW